MSATNEFRITQIVDNGQIIQLTLIENVSTEPISQKQMIIELQYLCQNQDMMVWVDHK